MGRNRPASQPGGQPDIFQVIASPPPYGGKKYRTQLIQHKYPTQRIQHKSWIEDRGTLAPSRHSTVVCTKQVTLLRLGGAATARQTLKIDRFTSENKTAFDSTRLAETGREPQLEIVTRFVQMSAGCVASNHDPCPILLPPNATHPSHTWHLLSRVMPMFIHLNLLAITGA